MNSRYMVRFVYQKFSFEYVKLEHQNLHFLSILCLDLSDSSAGLGYVYRGTLKWMNNTFSNY